MVITWRTRQCPHCGKDIVVSDRHQVGINFLETDKNQIVEKVELILQSSQDAYAKKIALFNLIKGLKVRGIEPDEEQRINCLLEGKFYNEISKEKMKEYKKLTIKDFSKN